MLGNPNNIFTVNHLEQLKRSNTQLLLGEIVDLEGDGGYRSALIQQYAIRVFGTGDILPACKVASQMAGYNGTGEYHNYRPGDVIIGTAKDGMLEEFIIMGAVRLNGDHSKFFSKGEALKPGELVDLPYGPAPSNQVSIHPSRATKPNLDFKILPAENIKTEYEDPIFYDNLEGRMNAQPLPGGVLTQSAGGDLLNYGYGSIINYSDGSNIILSNGTSENKCTRYLKSGKRHSLIAQFLSIIAPPPKGVGEEYTEAEEYKVQKEVTFNPFDAAVVRTFDVNKGDIEITNATVNAAINTALGVEDKKPTELTPVDTIESLGDSPVVERADHPAPASYRREQHTKLAELAVAQAEICNRLAAAQQTTAAGMTPQPGVASNTSTDPNQQNSNVNNANKGARDIPGAKPSVTKIPAHTANYKKGRSSTITTIVMHNTLISAAETINRFSNNLGYQTSAHYVIKRSGEIVQMVEDEDTAYQARAANSYSIGIEHEIIAELTEDKKHIKKVTAGMTSEMEAASIKLVKYLMGKHKINKDKVIPHRNIVKNTDCPSGIWANNSEFESWKNKNL